MSRAALTGKARLFLVGDHALTREHLTAMLALEADLGVCAEVPSGASALSLIHEQQPDLVLLDLSAQAARGLDILTQLAARRPELPVLVLAMQDEAFYVERALQAGARGYLLKEEAPSRILVAVRELLAGRSYLSPAAAERLNAKRKGNRAL